jgi:hypothetical protein
MKETPSSIDFICASKICSDLGEYFKQQAFSIKKYKDLKHYLSKIKKNHQIACILEYDLVKKSNNLIESLKAIKKRNPKIKIILLCPEKFDLNNQIFNEKGLFRVLKINEEFELLEQKIAKIFSLKLYKKVSGKSKQLVNQILKQLKTFETVEDYFDVVEGISMKYPTKYLSKIQSKENHIEFITNNSVDAYRIKDRSFYWNGDRTPVISGPETDTFKAEKKLVFHCNAPPVKVAIDTEKRAFGKSTYALIPKKKNQVNLLCCCAFLNSRVFDFYLHKIFNPLPKKGVGASFLNIHEVKQFPIPSKCFKGVVPEIEKKVVQLESLIKYTANGKSREIANLNKQLNQIFFDMFNLKESQIALLKELYF